MRDASVVPDGPEIFHCDWLRRPLLGPSGLSGPHPEAGPSMCMSVCRTLHAGHSGDSATRHYSERRRARGGQRRLSCSQGRLPQRICRGPPAAWRQKRGSFPIRGVQLWVRLAARSHDAASNTTSYRRTMGRAASPGLDVVIDLSETSGPAATPRRAARPTGRQGHHYPGPSSRGCHTAARAATAYYTTSRRCCREACRRGPRRRCQPLPPPCPPDG